MFTQEHAVEVAKQEFRKQGRAPADYDIATETYSADEHQWIIWFDKKGPYRIPGGKHAVLVHKVTGHAVYMRGE
ncbi:MAG: hypothetical protein KBG15_13655 [Kofleriaceae bacterium]|nr:hypothetical protein [Kofleriaceae bacterium]